MRLSLFSISLTIVASAVCLAQSGGPFQIDRSVIGGGGGSASGGNFDVILNTGQSIASKDLVGPPFAVTSGFFGFTPLGTTAALVSISGQVLGPTGGGIRNVFVTLSSPIHGSQTVLTTTFGQFRFDNVPIGETYVISVSSRRYSFDQPSRVINVLDEIDNLDFVAHEN